MAINKIYATILTIVISMVCCSFRCNKGIDCTENVYSFNLSVKAHPDKDSIHVGDTVWLEINEPTTLKDLGSGTDVDYSGAQNLGTAIGIAELISPNNINTEGNLFFNFFLATGNELARSDTSTFKEYSFKEIDEHYKFKVGIIPIKAGAYKVFISNAANVYKRNDKCTKASFGINFIDTNQHLYLNEIVLPDVTLPSGGGVYLFKVY